MVTKISVPWVAGSRQWKHGLQTHNFWKLMQMQTMQRLSKSISTKSKNRFWHALMTQMMWKYYLKLQAIRLMRSSLVPVWPTLATSVQLVKCCKAKKTCLPACGLLLQPRWMPWCWWKKATTVCWAQLVRVWKAQAVHFVWATKRKSARVLLPYRPLHVTSQTV